MSDNWVVGNLQNALNTWNEKLNEIWTLITQTPETFKGGSIWNIIVNINGAMQAIGLSLLVLFFLIGIVKTCGSFVEVKKPEQVLKLFIRFILTKIVITYGLELMLGVFKMTQGLIQKITETVGLGTTTQATLPQEMITAIENLNFFECIPLWAVTWIRRIFNNCIIICNDFKRVWKIFQNIFIYSACTHTTCNICRRANTTDRKKFYKEFLCSMFRGSSNNTCLCYIFTICKFSTNYRY